MRVYHSATRAYLLLLLYNKGLDLTLKSDIIALMTLHEQNPLEHAFTAAQVMRTDAFALSVEADKTIAGVRKRIREGESTRDPLRDLLIVRYGLEALSYEERYRDIQEQVRLHKGEFVLVVARREEVSGWDIPEPRSHDYVLRTSIGLGFLEDDKLVIEPKDQTLTHAGGLRSPALPDFGAGKCEFPTNAFAFYDDGQFRHEVSKVDRNLPAGLTALDEDLNLKNRFFVPFGDKSVKKLQVFIGNTVVQDWFSRTHKQDLFEKMSAAINRPTNGQVGFQL